LGVSEVSSDKQPGFANKLSVWSRISDIYQYWWESLALSAKRLFSKKSIVLDEEPYTTNWKNYYEILQVEYNANTSKITSAYKHILHSYKFSISQPDKEQSHYAELCRDAQEAYEVLANYQRRRMYDQVFKAKFLSVADKEPLTKEIVKLSGLIEKSVKAVRSGMSTRTSTPSKPILRLAIISILVVVLFLCAGTSFALAQPEHPIAQTLREPPLFILRLSDNAISLIEGTRDVTAKYERTIIQSSVSSMRVMENIQGIAPVASPTSDMSYFPSPDHPLFPTYLDRRYSQFKYILDEYGNVAVDTTIASTDSLLDKIEKTIISLEEQ
jgi:hypothetical protein